MQQRGWSLWHLITEATTSTALICISLITPLNNCKNYARVNVWATTNRWSDFWILNVITRSAPRLEILNSWHFYFSWIWLVLLFFFFFPDLVRIPHCYGEHSQLCFRCGGRIPQTCIDLAACQCGRDIQSGLSCLNIYLSLNLAVKRGWHMVSALLCRRERERDVSITHPQIAMHPCICKATLSLLVVPMMRAAAWQ